MQLLVPSIDTVSGDEHTSGAQRDPQGATQATSSSSAAVAARKHTPRLGWDLCLHPKRLNDAYWREQARKFMQWDTQVAWFSFALVMLSILKHSTSNKHSAGAHFRTWLVLATWLLLAIRAPRFYAAHRVPLVLALKFAMAVATVNTVNRMALPMRWQYPMRSYPTLLLQTAAINALMDQPVQLVGMPLPLWAQFASAVGRAGVLMLAGASRDVVALTNSPAFKQGFSQSNMLWARLVQSGQPWMVSADDSLQGHTAHMTAVLAAMHISTVAISMYLAYISQWVQVRAWLVAKASASLTPHAPERRREGAAANQLSFQSRDCPVEVCGVLVYPQQLLDVCRTHAAALLLDGQGVLGRAAMICFHAAIINTILLVSWLVSNVLVLRVAPRVLPKLLLSLYYPLAPGVGGDVCMPEDEPPFAGLLGRVLWLLGSDK